MAGAVRHLAHLWSASAERLRTRCEGLTDEEYFWEHAFGDGVRNFPDLPVPSSAEAGIRHWLDSREAVTGWLESAADEDLDEIRPSHLGAPRSVGDVVSILVDEQIHHGAEIAVLRDLFLRSRVG